MFRFGSTSRSTILRRAAIGISGGTALGGCYFVYGTDSGAGFRREATFWRRVGPVVFDYYWKTASSSPFVRYQKWKSSNNNNNDGSEEKEKRKELIQKLHEKHAPTILQVMLELKGLYIKLGQVLSVTALPVPEAYRVLFRTLQSDVPGYETFDEVVRPVLEKEYGKNIEDLFVYIDPIPCGAASIGQAHKAKLRRKTNINEDDGDDDDNVAGEEVIIKVQYPAASWQIPADIQCVGDFLKICVWTGAVDESGANLSFEEFSRQFLAELDYEKESSNLEIVWKSSQDPDAPYIKRNVVLPRVYKELCTKKIIVMTYLPGPKLESEAKKQLAILGIDTSTKNITETVRDAAKEAADPIEPEQGEVVRRVTKRLTDNDESNSSSSKLIRHVTKRLDSDDSSKAAAVTSSSWSIRASSIAGRLVGVDSILWAIRLARRLFLWSEAIVVASINATPRPLIPTSVEKWADNHRNVAAQAARLSLTREWIDALFDVHGHQIFLLGLFNADPHPGNILLIENDKDENGAIPRKLGLIDYGQCKRLTAKEQIQIAQLVLSVANDESDLAVASAFRRLGIKTKNDSTDFLAKFGRLMFGPLKPEHLRHSWHQDLHRQDRILYFPKELSMVYRTSLLLRGLAVSLQMNYSVADQWKTHAQKALDKHLHLID